jgi:protein tyrosine/serine phosphatase
MTRAPLLVSLFAASTLACASARDLRCEDGSSARPPRNFGRVLNADGRETAIYRGGQPQSCGELAYLHSLGVKTILKLNDRGLPIDAAEKREAAGLGLEVRTFAFSAATIGKPATCGSVRAALEHLANPDHWPVYVHCTAGKDRTGYIVGMYEKLALGKPEGEVMAALHRYGHRGIRSLLIPHINRELASDAPECSE